VQFSVGTVVFAHVQKLSFVEEKEPSFVNVTVSISRTDRSASSLIPHLASTLSCFAGSDELSCLMNCFFKRINSGGGQRGTSLVIALVFVVDVLIS
jgi:hypothetical protein